MRGVGSGYMHLQKVIEQFVHTPNEARVYLVALGLGESTIADLTAKTGLPRTSISVALESLHKQGLVNTYERSHSKFWIAENPERLLISSREREAALRTALPELAAKRHDRGGKPTIKVFSGVEEIKLILEDMIATKHHILGIAPWEEWLTLFGEEYMHDFIALRVSHFLRIKFLVPKTALSQKLRARDPKELRMTKYLPLGIRIPTSQYIYGNKVALISLNKNEPTGTVIEDGDIRDTMTVFFEELWERSSSE